MASYSPSTAHGLSTSYRPVTAYSPLASSDFSPHSYPSVSYPPLLTPSLDILELLGYTPVPQSETDYLYSIEPATSGREIIGITSAILFLVVLSVGLRLYARRKTSARISIDDVLVVIAAISSALLVAANIVGVVRGGLGYGRTDVYLGDYDQAPVLYQVVYIQQFFYITSVAFAKLAILAPYKRIFTGTQKPAFTYLLSGATAAWLIIFFFFTLLQYDPIDCYWKNFLPYDSVTFDKTYYPCEERYDIHQMYVISSITDIVLDVCILSLPSFVIWRLQMPVGKKLGIAAIFGLGVICVVASIARLVYSIRYQQAEVVWNPWTEPEFIANWVMWSSLEASLSTICASLPCYGPLIPWQSLDRLGIRAGRKARKMSSATANRFLRRPPVVEREDRRQRSDTLHLGLDAGNSMSQAHDDPSVDMQQKIDVESLHENGNSLLSDNIQTTRSTNTQALAITGN